MFDPCAGLFFASLGAVLLKARLDNQHYKERAHDGRRRPSHAHAPTRRFSRSVGGVFASSLDVEADNHDAHGNVEQASLSILPTGVSDLRRWQELEKREHHIWHEISRLQTAVKQVGDVVGLGSNDKDDAAARALMAKVVWALTRLTQTAAGAKCSQSKLPKPQPFREEDAKLLHDAPDALHLTLAPPASADAGNLADRVAVLESWRDAVNAGVLGQVRGIAAEAASLACAVEGMSCQVRGLVVAVPRLRDEVDQQRDENRALVAHAAARLLPELTARITDLHAALDAARCSARDDTARTERNLIADFEMRLRQERALLRDEMHTAVRAAEERLQTSLDRLTANVDALTASTAAALEDLRRHAPALHARIDDLRDTTAANLEAATQGCDARAAAAAHDLSQSISGGLAQAAAGLEAARAEAHGALSTVDADVRALLAERFAQLTRDVLAARAAAEHDTAAATRALTASIEAVAGRASGEAAQVQAAALAEVSRAEKEWEGKLCDADVTTQRRISEAAAVLEAELRRACGEARHVAEDARADSLKAAAEVGARVEQVRTTGQAAVAAAEDALRIESARWEHELRTLENALTAHVSRVEHGAEARVLSIASAADRCGQALACAEAQLRSLLRSQAHTDGRMSALWKELNESAWGRTHTLRAAPRTQHVA